MKKKKEIESRFAPVGAWSADVVLLIGEFDLIKPWVQKNVTNDRKEEVLRHLADPDNKAGHTNLGRTYFLSGGGSLIWLREYKPEILVHEIVHAAHHVLLSKATPLTDSTEEAYAYLIEHLYKSLSSL